MNERADIVKYHTLGRYAETETLVWVQCHYCNLRFGSYQEFVQHQQKEHVSLLQPSQDLLVAIKDPELEKTPKKATKKKIKAFHRKISKDLERSITFE